MKLELTKQEVEFVLAVLSRLPLNEVFGLFTNIKAQFDAQNNKPST